MGYEKITINVPAEKKDFFDAYLEIARREHVSLSRLGIKMLEEFVARHRAGNPQLPLFLEPTPTYVNPVLEVRRDLLSDLLAHIRAHPGIVLDELIGDWGRIHGVREETAKSYLRQLARAKKIGYRGSKVYPLKKTEV